MTTDKMKKFREKMLILRDEFQKRKGNRPNLVSPVDEPRYDDVFIEGIKCIENRVGDL